MRHAISAILNDRAGHLRPRIAAIYGLLIAANLAAWAWAAGGLPQPSGAARHGASGLRFRAAPRGGRRPHRRDRQRHAQADAGGQAAGRGRLLLLARPFDRRRARHRSASRSTATRARRTGSALQERSAASIGTLVSALFLFAIALMNIVVLLVGVSHLPARARAAAPYIEEDLDMLLARARAARAASSGRCSA